MVEPESPDLLISPKHWARIEFIASQVLDASGPHRGQLLDEICPPTDPLRDAVERILRAAESSAVFLDAPPIERLTVSSTLRPPDRLGPYALLRKIGSGGMGQVWLAERADGAFDRKVAIKWLASASLDTVARLESERKILALIDHPHVARLYDGGVDPSGRPYLVMEWVDGEPIDAYCARHALSLPARIDLLLDLCAAVSAIHDLGLVHRDIKPANVLVRRDGTVKLVDFGIARPVTEMAGLLASMTRTGQRPMTLGYASPEQVLGQPASAATDIHGLGLVACELCSGSRAFARDGWTLYELEREIGEGRVPMPSEIAVRRPAVAFDFAGSAATLRPPGDVTRLRRDLANFVDPTLARALAKRPDRRLASARALADELREARRKLCLPAWRRSWSYRPWGHSAKLLAVLCLGMFAIGRPLGDPRVDPQVAEAFAATTDLAERAAADRHRTVLLPVRASEGTDVALARAVDHELRSRLQPLPRLRLLAFETSEVISGYDWTSDRVASYLRADYEIRATISDLGETLRLRLAIYRSSDRAVAFDDSVEMAPGTLDSSIDGLLGELARSLGWTEPERRLYSRPWDRALAEAMGVLYWHRLGAANTSRETVRASLARAASLRPNAPAVRLEKARFLLHETCQNRAAFARAAAWVQEALDDGEATADDWLLAALRGAQSRDWRAAAAAFRASAEIDGGSADSLRWASYYASTQGLHDIALRLANQAVLVDPLAARSRRALALVLGTLGKRADALQVLRDADTLRADQPATNFMIAELHLLEGRRAEALRFARRETHPVFRQVGLALVLGPQRDDGALAGLVETRARELAYQIASVYAFHGQPDLAIEWLERAEAYGDCGLPRVSVDPLLASVRDRPRVQDLAARLGLPQ